MRGVVIFDSHARVIWMTKPAVGTKEDYLGVLAWEYAATTDDIQRVQLAWAHTLTFGTPVACSFDTHPNVVAGSWFHTYQRLDNTPIVVAEWRAIVTNPLGKRELEIALHFANDWKAGEVCEKFNITANTVETVRKRINAKLGVRGVAGVTRWLIRAGLLEA